MIQTNWSDLFKIRLSNIVSESMDKHDIVKTLIVRKLLRRYKKRAWIRIYCEFKLDRMTPDIYFENLKDKSVICYEIQKTITKKWEEETIKKYNSYDVPNFNSIDLIIVPLRELSNDIRILNKQLDKYIF